MYDKMGQLFQTPPEIMFHCECYHYETEYYTVRTVDGYSTRSRTIKVTTYTENFAMPYYSARDVSGLFYLNCEEAHVKQKPYIQLELLTEVNFADPISYMDYMAYKDDFWRRNRFRDAYFDYCETRTVPGLTQYNLIKIGDHEPCIVNFFWFIIFTIISFAEIYKIIFKSFCIYQDFRIRKLVSTRYNLNLDMNAVKYEPLIPRVDLVAQQFTYEPTKYNYVNPNVHVNLPGEEELRQAEQYKDKIPDYKVSSGNGQFHAGVIIDKPEYSSSNYNDPPPEFVGYRGDVKIDKSLINPSGGVPKDFKSNQINTIQEKKDENKNKGKSSNNFNVPPINNEINNISNRSITSTNKIYN